MWNNENRSIFVTRMQLKFKRNKELNIKLDMLNEYFIEGQVGNSLDHIGMAGNLLNRTPKTQAPRLTIDKWNLGK